jgi:hypothetical protein
MSEPPTTVPGPPTPEGGERRRLDRAPGDRYAGEPGSGGRGGRSDAGSDEGSGRGPRASRALVAAVLVADAGAILFFLLGLLDLGPGLLAVAAFNGWVTALALVRGGRDAIPAARTRVAVAAFLGGWSVVGGIVVDWVYALVQGGVLGPLDYVAQRYGLVALLAVVLAAGVAAVRAR